MKPVDYEKARLEVFHLDSRVIRPWHLNDGEYHKYLNGVVTPEAVLHSLIRARVARTKAESYRDFSVGVCGIIHSADGIVRDLAHGANLKDAPGQSAVDVHGEDFVINSLEKDDRLLALAVVAPLQPDSGSGRETPTLHPCFKCRARIAGIGGPAVNTLIICASPDFTAVQWGGINDYIAHHQDESHQLPTARFGETPELFHPVPIVPGQPLQLGDPRLEVDTKEWDAKVTFPVLEWVMENQYQNT